MKRNRISAEPAVCHRLDCNESNKEKKGLGNGTVTIAILRFERLAVSYFSHFNLRKLS